MFTYLCNNGKTGKLGNSQYYQEAHLKKNLFIKKKLFSGFISNDFPSLKTSDEKQILVYKNVIVKILDSIIQIKTSTKWTKLRFDS